MRLIALSSLLASARARADSISVVKEGSNFSLPADAAAATAGVLSVLPAGKPSLVVGQLETRIKIYVYDDPELDGSSDLIECYQHRGHVSPWQDEHVDTAQDMGEVWMHRALLEHPWRVLDPREADLFYIPLYPVLSYKLLQKGWKCKPRSHHDRMHDAVTFLERKSPYFNRYGGADHVLVCAWWQCKVALDRFVRMRLARTVVGINEELGRWSKWGCTGQMVAIPYTPNSLITTVERIGGRAPENRDVLFFFAGTARNRPERENLKVVRRLYPDSTIELGHKGSKWLESAKVYANHITRSRYCFCPRGDTRSSRRIFDAIAAGCIPVLTEEEHEALPFVSSGLDYSEFAIVAPRGTFNSLENVTALVQDLATRTDQDLEPMRRKLRQATGSIVYGLTVGEEVTDMRPYRNVADRFMQEAWRRFVGSEGGSVSDGNVWSCPPSDLSEEELAPRTWYKFPVPADRKRQWLCDSETIVNEENKLLFCAIPNTGSMQFRMLAKRMQGVEHWAVYDDREKLFDPVTSGLNLLDTSKTSLMKEIYAETGSGWVKIVVVRDPVTRLLSAYLDLVRIRKNWNGSDRDNRPDDEKIHDRRAGRQLRGGSRDSYLNHPDGVSVFEGGNDTLEFLANDEIRVWEAAGDAMMANEGRGLSLSTGESAKVLKDVSVSQRQRGLNSPAATASRNGNGDWAATMEGEGRGGGGRKTAANKKRKSASIFDEEGEGDVVSFEEFLDRLADEMPNAGPAFRPQTSLCGLKHATFDSVIPFETLKTTARSVVKSLPASIWDEYASSGWGPRSDNEFMEYDYYGADSWLPPDSRDASIPVSTGDLFDDSSCGWTKFYTNESMLQKVSEIYAPDYVHFGWYETGGWKRRLSRCLNV